MNADDARYEASCRLLLAVAAGIHWVAAALVWREGNLAEVEFATVYAWVDSLVSAVAALI